MCGQSVNLMVEKEVGYWGKMDSMVDVRKEDVTKEIKEEVIEDMKDDMTRDMKNFIVLGHILCDRNSLLRKVRVGA